MFNNNEHKITPSQWSVMSLVVVSTAGSLLYRLLRHQHLGHSAAMFLGLPAVLAILLAAAPRPRSATGAIVKGLTLMLLVVAPLLGEGWICILIASPLFYAVGIGVGVAVDWQRRRKAATLSCVAVLLLPFSLEGVVPQWTFPRLQTVSVTRVVNASPAAVEQSLAHSPQLQTPLPLGMRLFPRPLAAWGDGLAVGDVRAVHFAGAEGHSPGDLRMKVVASGPGYVRTAPVDDASKLMQWAAWTGSDVEWKPLDATHTQVTWRLSFERELDPAWYFAPLERAVVREAAEYMIAANATPQREAGDGRR